MVLPAVTKALVEGVAPVKCSHSCASGTCRADTLPEGQIARVLHGHRLPPLGSVDAKELFFSWKLLLGPSILNKADGCSSIKDCILTAGLPWQG
jgi:hypothetical protein